MSDRNCWKCGSRDIEELVPVITFDPEEDGLSRLKRLARECPELSITTYMRRVVCPICQGVAYGLTKKPPCMCEQLRFWQAS